MKLSDKTKRKLIRYAKAVHRREIERVRGYFRDGSTCECDPNLPTMREWADARAALRKCSEPNIKKLVRQIQIKRLDEAGFNRMKIAEVVSAAFIADNELIALGHKLAK